MICQYFIHYGCGKNQSDVQRSCMSKRYSERLIETFRDDELSKLNEDGLQGRSGTTSRIPRQCSGDESLPMYRSAHGGANPFRCRACGNPQIRAFATMYAQGTSTAVSMKGFFFKHSYQKTWRQTEMAKMCTPPRKKAFWPALLLLAIATGERLQCTWSAYR